MWWKVGTGDCYLSWTWSSILHSMWLLGEGHFHLDGIKKKQCMLLGCGKSACANQECALHSQDYIVGCYVKPCANWSILLCTNCELQGALCNRFMDKYTVVYARWGHATCCKDYFGLSAQHLWSISDLWLVSRLPCT
jgi:hypothetical protein